MFILCNVVKNIYIGEEVLYFRAMRVYGIVKCKIQRQYTGTHALTHTEFLGLFFLHFTIILSRGSQFFFFFFLIFKIKKTHLLGYGAPNKLAIILK